MTTKEKILEEIKDINYAYNDCSKYATIKNLLEEMEEERKKGKWITKSTFMPDHYGGYYIDKYVCTNCESEFFKPSKFCPNCGSDQRGDGNENNRCR